MLIIESTKIEYTGGHIRIMLIIEIAKIESTGRHIEIMLIIEITKIKFTFWIYCIYIDYQNGQDKILDLC